MHGDPVTNDQHEDVVEVSEQQSSSESGGWPEAFDPGWFYQRARLFTLQPKSAFAGLKDEPATVFGIYKSYLLALAAIPAVCNFIGMVVIGQSLPFVGTYRWPFFRGLVYTIGQYGLSLVLLGMAALIMEKLAVKFKGKTDLISTMKLLAAVATPACLAGIFNIIPTLSILALFGALYGIYVLYLGIPAMTGVSSDKRTPYLLVSLLSCVVVAIGLSLVLRGISPSMPELEELNFKLPDGTKVDMQELNQGIENLQKMFPQADMTQ